LTAVEAALDRAVLNEVKRCASSHTRDRTELLLRSRSKSVVEQHEMTLQQ
jgi:hypothetical protein